MSLTRRQFLAAAAATGTAALLPAELLQAAHAATATSPTTAFFFTPEELATATALTERIVPSTDPLTGAPAPGAAEAHAAIFIDRLLAAFSLPPAVADNPAVYLRGRFSNRNPYPDYQDGEPSSQLPPDSFLSPDGQAHFVGLDALQELSWRAQIEGLDAALAAAPGWVSKVWVSQVRSGLIPGPPPQGLQQIYRAGLAAFDAYAKSLFSKPYAQASPPEQDVMLEAAGNVVVSQIPLPSPPGAPAAAKTLYPYLVTHTFEGCYGLPEYRWLDSNPLWAEIRWDGDTEPLGNSIYDEDLYGPGQGPNAGYGEEGVYVPRGGYREHRPVSYLGPGGGPPITQSDIAPLVEALEKAGVIGSPEVWR